MALDFNEVKNDTAEEPPIRDLPESMEETAAPVEASAPAEAKSELDALGDIVPERAMPSIDEATPAVAADEPAAAAETAAEAAPTDDEEEAARKLAEENGIGIDQAREMLSRQARIEYAKQAGATQSEAEAAADHQARALQQMMRQQGGGGGGGAVAALVGGIGSAVKGMAGLAAAGVGKIRNRPDMYSPEAVRERTFDYYRDIYEKSLDGYSKAGDDLKKGVEEFNAAFLKTEAAARLRKMAKDADQGLDDFIADLNEGRNTNAEALAAAESAFSDPRVRTAADRIANAEARAAEHQEGIGRMMDKIGRNFADQIDPSIEAERIDDAAHSFGKDMKNPIYESKTGGKGKSKDAGEDAKQDEESRKLFSERMKELTERIRKIVDAILSKLGLRPKP